MIVPLLILLPVVYAVYAASSNFWRNWQAAKSSGIPYILAPTHHFDRLWITTEPLWFMIIDRLPLWLTSPWKDVISGEWAWQMRYAPFERLKTDTFINVNPIQNLLSTADPSVISQITARRNDFVKPVDLYDSLDIYGKNVVTTEGNVWRRHRRITAPPFGEHNNRVVFKEAIFQASEMLRSWTTLGLKLESKDSAKPDGDVANGRIAEIKQAVTSLAEDVSKDTMRLSLHIISRAGFDVRCLWPGLEDSSGATEGAMKSGEVPAGHAMSYTDSIQTLLHRVILLLLFPDWFLRLVPSQAFRDARTSFKEWGHYMQQIFDRNVRLIKENVAEKKTQKNSEVEGLDLMGSMIEQSGMIEGTPNYGNGTAGLSQSEVMGNSFVLFLAGHETAANSIHFAIVYLALRPGLQRRLQAELDSIFGDRDPTKGEWDYDTDLPRLFSGLAGAIMNEELRLIPPVVNIPKTTEPGKPVPLVVNGKQCTVPGNTKISLNAVGVHRNPNVWPHGPVRTRLVDGKRLPDPVHPLSNTDNDLEEFKPERWLLDERALAAQNRSSNSTQEDAKDKAADDLAVNAAPDTATTMFRPPRGAYIPFSEGHRSCVGRRFAQVEILATLAVVFHRHSVELSVNEPEHEVAKADEKERKAMWDKAREEAERKLRVEMGTVFTLQLRKEGIKLRVCRRGNEVFDYREY